MGAAQKLPKLQPPSISLDVPTWPKELAQREHNKFAREALTDELKKHYRVRVPQHFKATARAKYGYAPRSAAYKKMKLRRYGSRTDLVKTGMTEQAFTKGDPKIVISGSATSQRGFSGRLVLGSFPFMIAARMLRGGGRYIARRFKPKTLIGRLIAARMFKPKGGVNLDQMRKEIICFTPDESKDVANGFLAGYMRRVRALMAQGKRKRFGGNRKP